MLLASVFYPNVAHRCTIAVTSTPRFAAVSLP